VLNTAQAIFTAVWSAFWISTALIARVLTFGTRIPLSMARWGWGPGMLWGAGARLEITGLEHIDRTKSYVFVANHSSMIDVAVTFSAIPVNVRYVLKRELARVPFIGWYAWGMGMVFVDRGNSAQAIAALKKATDSVRRGPSIIAHPEGTRWTDGRIHPFKKGPFVLAIEAGVELVPMAIVGAEKVLPRNGFKVRPGVIKVAFGAPIPPGDDKVALIGAVRSKIIELHTRIGGRGGDDVHVATDRS